MAFDRGAPALPLIVGSTVVDSAGEKIGILSEVGESYFKVDVHMARDFWLPVDLVDTFDQDMTRLTLPENDLEPHKLDSGAEQLPTAEFDGIVSPKDVVSPSERIEASKVEYFERPHQL